MKIWRAIENAIQNKDYTTDILYHLKKEFPDIDVKKMFHNFFNKEYLIDENLLNETKSKIDNRKKEYRLDELHKIYDKFVKICQKYSNLDCKEIVKIFILERFFEYQEKEYDILEKIEKELIKVLTPQIPQRERDRITLSLMSSHHTPFEFNIYEYIYKEAFKDVKKLIDIEKLNNEVLLLKNIIISAIKAIK